MPDFISRYWAQIRAQASEMPANTRLLIGSLVIILLLVGFVVITYVAEPEMVPLKGYARDQQAAVAGQLEQKGFDVRSEGNELFVPIDQRTDAIAAMGFGGFMKGDFSDDFDDTLANMTPWDSHSKTSMAFLYAKQKFLSQVIGKMRNVGSASVVISMPDTRKFGRSYEKPSASVNVVMNGGAKIDKQLVGAITGMVSGAVSAMNAQEVVVIDAMDGRAHRMPGENEISADTARASMLADEQKHRMEIERLLYYIPGVIVAVNMRGDGNGVVESDEYEYEKNQPLDSDKSLLQTTTSKTNVGEPGIRSNVGSDVNTGSNGGGGNTSTTEETLTTFKESLLKKRTRARKVGQTATEINVTVNVPHSYFVTLFKQGAAADTEPTEAELKPIVDKELEKIRAQVLPLTKTETSPGLVSAHMILDARAVMAMSNIGGEGGAIPFMEGDYFQKGVLLGLALLSVTMMLLMARKATRHPPLPTAQELAGVPPHLDSEDELVGEVDGHDPSMLGVELSDEDVSTRQVADQINELVTSYPQEASWLFKRWVNMEEY